jgi:hypothetical protein
MTDFGQVHVIERFEHLKDEYFAYDRMKRSFKLSLFFDHYIETRGYEFHNDA